MSPSSLKSIDDRNEEWIRKYSYFIDEVGCFDGPSAWYVVALNLDLLRQDVVTDLFPALAHIGSLKAKNTIEKWLGYENSERWLEIPTRREFLGELRASHAKIGQGAGQ